MREEPSRSRSKLVGMGGRWRWYLGGSGKVRKFDSAAHVRKDLWCVDRSVSSFFFLFFPFRQGH